MSPIFGAVQLDGRPATPWPHVRQGRASVWEDGPALLGRSATLSASGPVRDAAGHVALVATGHLDDRDGLRRALGIASPDASSPDPSDGALLLRAFERWGEDCAPHLLGDWALAVWDTRRRALVLAHDFIGACGLYYHRSDRLFVFASSLPMLLTHPEVPRRLNPVALAQLSAHGKRGASTCYAGVESLPPGHTLTVTAEATRSRRYWHPERIAPVRHRSDGEYLEAFREVYGEAVRCRVAGDASVGLLLSGGLDSASVAAFAAPALAHRGSRLASFTWTPHFPVMTRLPTGRYGDERARVERIRDHVGNIDTTFVATADGPMAGLAWMLGAVGQPSWTAASTFWMRPMLDAARAHGVGTLLTGDWGNFTISWTGVRTDDAWAALDPRRWSQLAREARTQRAMHGGSVFQRIRRQVLRPIVAAGRRRLRGPADHVRAVVRGDAALAALRDAPDALPELETLRRRARQPHRTIYNLSQSGAAADGGTLAAAAGLEHRVPTLDQRIVEFCLGLPVDRFARGGETRLLVREGMAGLLPPETLWDPQRGQTASDLPHRVRAEQDAIAAVLDDLHRSPLARHWLDLPEMVRGFAAVRERNDATGLDAFGPTLRGLAVGLFLLKVDGG